MNKEQKIAWERLSKTPQERAMDALLKNLEEMAQFNEEEQYTEIMNFNSPLSVTRADSEKDD